MLLYALDESLQHATKTGVTVHQGAKRPLGLQHAEAVHDAADAPQRMNCVVRRQPERLQYPLERREPGTAGRPHFRILYVGRGNDGRVQTGGSADEIQVGMAKRQQCVRSGQPDRGLVHLRGDRAVARQGEFAAQLGQPGEVRIYRRRPDPELPGQLLDRQRRHSRYVRNGAGCLQYLRPVEPAPARNFHLGSTGLFHYFETRNLGEQRFAQTITY